jgi:hypothetical protein
MLADLSPAPAAKYAIQAANFGAAPSGGSGVVAREPGGIAFRGYRKYLTNILRKYPFTSAIFPTSSRCLPQRADGWFDRGKRPYALACNVTTLTGRVARLRRSDRPPSPAH